MKNFLNNRSTDVWRIQHEVAGKSLRDFLWLYSEWIFPNKPSDFKDKTILDAGSGPGIQIEMYAHFAKRVVAVDLEAIATSRNSDTLRFTNIEFVQENISNMWLGESFDVVNCVGVIHHTDAPSVTFKNLERHLKSGGRMIIWAYAKEGNFLMERFVEPIRKRFLADAEHSRILVIARVLTFLLYPIVYSFYLLPLVRLPYSGYFANFRRLSFERNVMNVYDKLNAPQQHFIPRKTIEDWFDHSRYSDVYIEHYAGVSWRASGTKL